MNDSGHDSIRRVFAEVFTARDIAEPLVSFDGELPVTAAGAKMDAGDFDIVGVRQSGLVNGYVEREQLQGETCVESMKSIEAAELIADSATLADVVRGLSQYPRLFVKILGAVGGIITKSDLQKPAVRMWLFGMVTLIETRFTNLIDRCLPGDGWHEFISEGRLQKARDLCAERQRRNQWVRLLDCLQLADKGQILARNAEIRRQTQFESRRQVEDAFKRVERLRNNLAHSQDIVSGDWSTILQLAENLDRVIRGPTPLPGDDASD